MRWKGMGAMCGMGKRAGHSWEEILNHSWRWEKFVWKVVSIYFSHSEFQINFPHYVSVFSFYFWVASFFQREQLLALVGKMLPFFLCHGEALLWLLNIHVGVSQGILRAILLLLRLVPSSSVCWAWKTSISTLCTGLPPTLFLWALNY